MYHTIEFRFPMRAQLEVTGIPRLVEVFIKQGARVRAQIKPYVVETSLGPVEVADLLLEDGTAAREVRFASFQFIND